MQLVVFKPPRTFHDSATNSDLCPFSVRAKIMRPFGTFGFSFGLRSRGPPDPRPDLTCVFLGTPDPRPDLPGVLVDSSSFFDLRYFAFRDFGRSLRGVVIHNIVFLRTLLYSTRGVNYNKASMTLMTPHSRTPNTTLE